MGEVVEIQAWAVIVTIALAIIANISALGVIHWRGMLKVAEIRGEINVRFTALETSVSEMNRSIHKNGFARTSDLERIEERVDDVAAQVQRIGGELHQLAIQFAATRGMSQ
jgi:hypothetical protein